MTYLPSVSRGLDRMQTKKVSLKSAPLPCSLSGGCSEHPLSLTAFLSGGGAGNMPTCVHQPPADCLPPLRVFRQIVPVRSGGSLLHHSNCSVVCVHQGSSRDSKLNSNMQFIQDLRSIERLSAEPTSLHSWRQTFIAASAVMLHACLLGPRLSGMGRLSGSAAYPFYRRGC